MLVSAPASACTSVIAVGVRLTEFGAARSGGTSPGSGYANGVDAGRCAGRTEEILGHADIKTTLHYVSLRDQALTDQELAALGAGHGHDFVALNSVASCGPQ
jgi:hypothetical protein